MNQEIINSLLEDNQIDHAEFKKHPESINVLECFHFNLPSHPVFSDFPSLTELRIIEQDVCDLNWLKDCPNLVTLHVYHTEISNTQGLEKCPLLHSIILEANKLKSFPDISALKNLEYIDLSNNNLTEISSFPNSLSLRFLNIAHTGLKFIDKSIVNMPNIEILNVSGNNFSDFSSISSISLLQKLQQLYFYDPRYGFSPICSSPNYDTMISTFFPNIIILDTFKIPDKFKTISNTRKKMAQLYYDSISASDNTFLQIERSTFYSSIIIDTPKPSDLIQLFAKYENRSKNVEKFTYSAALLENCSGGYISISRIDPKTIPTMSIPESHVNDNPIYVWSIQYFDKELDNNFRFIYSNTEESNDSYEFIECDSLITAIKIIQDKNKSKVKIPDKTGNDIVISFNDDICKYILLFGEDDSQLFEKIDTLKGNVVYPEGALIRKKFEPNPSSNYTSLTLVDCGINNLSIFAECQTIEILNLPHNSITTLTDLPLLPKLKELDVSYNQIRYFKDFIPQSQASSSTIEKLIVHGNPGFTPSLLSILSLFFTNAKFPDFSITKTKPQYIISDIDMNLGTQENNITFLDISGGFISTLKPLEELQCLERLYASNCGIENIDFSHPILHFLDLSNNGITTFPEQSQFPSLEILMLNCNRIQELKPNSTIFGLFIAQNKIQCLPSSTDFPNLIALHIIPNPIIGNPSDSKILFQFPQLKMINGVLTTAKNHKKAKSSFAGVLFEEDLDQMITSDTLDLSNQEMKNIDCLHSEKLSNLILSNNNLMEIKWQNGALPNLNKLKMDKNSIGSSIPHPKRTEPITNPLSFLADNILPQLKILDLSDCKLSNTDLQNIVDMKFPHLLQLNLSQNSFKAVDIFKKVNFPFLDVLDLSHNFISTIPSGFIEDTQLRVLNLGYNSLKSLDNIFCATLLNLDLSHNRVTTVEEVSKISKCKALQKFWFNDNPLNGRISHRIRCICFLRSLRELDGKAVTESDQSQVAMVLEQMGIPSSQSSNTATIGSGSRSTMNHVVLSPNLPALQPSSHPKRSGGRNQYH